MSSMSSMSCSMSSRMLSQMSDVIRVNMVMVVEECGKHYGFDVEEALLMLGMEKLSLDVQSSKEKANVSSKLLADVSSKEKVDVSSKEKVGKPVKEKVVKEKVVKEKSVKVKAAFALPYNGEFNADTCFALKGELYTQCDSKRIEGGSFCKGCQSKADKNESGKPDSGTIKDRQAVGIFEYVDGKGKKPIAYGKVMSKLNLTREQVEEEAGKLNMIINEDHFVSTEKGAKGRPKKTKKVIEIGGAEEDLFASLVEEALCDEVEVASVVEVPVEVEEAGAKEEADRIAKELAKAEEKAAKELAKEAEKAAKELAKAEEKAAKELAKEAEKAAKELAKEQEKAEKAAKEQAKAQEKAAKELAKEQEKAEKAAKEQAKAQEKAAKEQEKAAKKKKQEVAPAAEDEPEVVKKIEENGKFYLKSKKSGLIYDYNEYKKNGEQVLVGKWNDKTNKIDFKASTDEESEDEYDEDDN